MKKLLLLGIIALGGTASCRTKCPAYSATKPDTQVAAPAMASTAQESAHQ
ncbi:hypothetical protein HNQ93_003754 [Hymenobacter luteus]|uniref:Lipoprotein n=2 Tax=Hymenobacter TaxID=89966 RepID=A0A7W9WCH0_9BACT|nr:MULTISPECIES: hypothetical protein [Hymenobacter]MBB4602987.1 hypothetical protein [Hymenobacter latericoloratus]MBB6060879.1 hypothetical protein [Hymenobacter luteus]